MPLTIKKLVCPEKTAIRFQSRHTFPIKINPDSKFLFELDYYLRREGDVYSWLYFLIEIPDGSYENNVREIYLFMGILSTGVNDYKIK